MCEVNEPRFFASCLKVVFQYPSRQCLSLLNIAKVRESLMRLFVPENIGFRRIQREDFINNHDRLCKHFVYSSP